MDENEKEIKEPADLEGVDSTDDDFDEEDLGD